MDEWMIDTAEEERALMDQRDEVEWEIEQERREAYWEFEREGSGGPEGGDGSGAIRG